MMNEQTKLFYEYLTDQIHRGEIFVFQSLLEDPPEKDVNDLIVSKLEDLIANMRKETILTLSEDSDRSKHTFSVIALFYIYDNIDCKALAEQLLSDRDPPPF